MYCNNLVFTLLTLIIILASPISPFRVFLPVVVSPPGRSPLAGKLLSSPGSSEALQIAELSVKVGEVGV